MTLQPRIEIYKDAAGEWRWRAKAENGEIVADGGEGYINRVDCVAVAQILFPNGQFAEEATQ
jgi:uncharacterized protein YegP (UPF0339 family)